MAQRRLSLAGAGVLASAAALGGCSTPSADEGFESAAPGARLYAINEAARKKDAGKIPELIRSLDSDDPVVRWTAIHALKDMTGEDYGYDFAAPWAERQRAIERWRAAYPRGGIGQSGRGSGPVGVGAGVVDTMDAKEPRRA